MHSIIVLAIIFGSITLWIAIIPATIILIKKMNRGGFSKKSQGAAEKEARMIQEIYQGLSKMEERVETLETLLLEKERKDKR